MTNCFICETLLTNITDLDYGVQHKIDCPQCGKYELHGFALDDQDFANWDQKKRNFVSFYIRHSQKKNSYPIWDNDRIQHVLKNRSSLRPTEQMNYLLQWIGDNSSHIGDMISADVSPIIGSTGCVDRGAVFHLLSELEARNLIEFQGLMGGQSAGMVTLLLDGWDYYDKLSKSSEASNNVFMAMKFGDLELNTFFENSLKPAVLQTGCSLFKLDDRPEAGLIDIRMRQEIKNSKFIIADLTHHNAGAYWEAGFAEGIGKQVIYTCEKSVFESPETKPHFDVNHHLTIIWDKDNPENAVAEIKAAIRYTFPETKQEDNTLL